MNERKVKVWDRPVRLFHWSLVALVAAGVVTGYYTPEWWMGLHAAAGYGLVFLLAFRVVWAFFGSEYARLASFAPSPRAVIAHLRGLVLLRPPHYLGHNPAGAVMILALIAGVVAIVATGLIVLGGEENQGPLAGLIDYATAVPAKAWHGALVLVLLSMAGLHVAGVAVESLLSRDNLVRAMITGYKRLPPEAPRPEIRPARPVAAATALGGLVLLAGGGLYGVSRLPPSGLIALPANEAYASECGDCHWAFHPSLLPAASWRGLMAHLDDHFGEDASLPDDLRAQIADYLAAYAAEAWDTEAANRFRTVSAAAPWRVTATPYWVRKHRGIAAARFAGPPVYSKANCAACHHDAASGRFDDQEIVMPAPGPNDQSNTGA